LWAAQGWLHKGSALHGMGRVIEALSAWIHGLDVATSTAEQMAIIAAIAQTEAGEALRRLKLMLVGAGRSGKTTLNAAMLNKLERIVAGMPSTVGIDAMTCRVEGATVNGAARGWAEVRTSTSTHMCVSTVPVCACDDEP
jgi:hypothetical protein